MASVQDIRAAADTKLDKWEAQAAAIETQLQMTREQALDHLEDQKQKLNAVVGRIKESVGKSKELAEQTKTKIQGSLDHLQVQLALGKAETRDAYEAQKQRITHAMAEFEASVDAAAVEADRELEADFDALEREFVAASDALEAELDAVDAQFQAGVERGKAEFEQKKQELDARISAFRDEVNVKREMTGEKLATFEDELSAGASKIKDAFTKLFQ